MSYNIVCFGKKRDNFRKAIVHGTIGSFLSTFPEHIKKGSTIFLYCESQILGQAKVSSDYFHDQTPIWEDKVYPHRFRIEQIQIFERPVSLVNGVYNQELRKRYGTGWAYKFIFSPKPLPEDVAKQISAELTSAKTVPVGFFLKNYH